MLNKLSLQRRNIEILKVRFGESPLQVCEVMLRDMTDSRRIDQHVQAQKQVRISVKIVHQFHTILIGTLQVLPPSYNHFQAVLALSSHQQTTNAGPI